MPKYKLLPFERVKAVLVYYYFIKINFLLVLNKLKSKSKTVNYSFCTL